MEGPHKRVKRSEPNIDGALSLSDLFARFPYFYATYVVAAHCPLRYRGLLAATGRAVRAHVLRHDPSVRFMCEACAAEDGYRAQRVRARVFAGAPYECVRAEWARFRAFTPYAEYPLSVCAFGEDSQIAAMLVAPAATSMHALLIATLAQRAWMERNLFNPEIRVSCDDGARRSITWLLGRLFAARRYDDIAALAIREEAPTPEWRADRGLQLWLQSDTEIHDAWKSFTRRGGGDAPRRRRMIRAYEARFRLGVFRKRKPAAAAAQ